MPKESLRGTYGKTLLKLGKTNKELVVMDADLAKSTKTITFGKTFPERFFDMGLSEQDMISTAAGIALTNKTVFVSTFCVFIAGRAYDQVRQSVCYTNANVKLVGTHSGLGVGADGATHQALEDIALFRPLPNIRIFVPADATETARVIEYIADNYGPFFVRLTRNDLENIYNEDHKFEFGKASILKDGKDITIFAIGSMVEKALTAAKELEKEGIDAAVINLSTIKPLDEDTVLDYAKKTKGFVTIEDHSIYGGLGSTIAEFLSQNHPIEMRIIGVENQFGRSGSTEDLYEYFELTSERIIAEAKNILSRK